MAIFDMPVGGCVPNAGNVPDLNNVIDLSKIVSIDESAMIIYGLIDGSRLIGEIEIESEDDRDIIMKRPLRILMRPSGDNRLVLDLIEHTIGAVPGSNIKISKSAVVFSYKPDKNIAQGYADHISRNQG